MHLLFRSEKKVRAPCIYYVCGGVARGVGSAKFGRVVICCIDAEYINQVFIFQHFLNLKDLYTFPPLQFIKLFFWGWYHFAIIRWIIRRGRREPYLGTGLASIDIHTKACRKRSSQHRFLHVSTAGRSSNCNSSKPTQCSTRETTHAE